MASGTLTAHEGPAAGAAGASEQPPRLPAGPRLPSLALTLLWAVAPTWVMDRCAERLGEAFTLTFWPSGMQLVMISDPEAVKDILTAPPELAPSGAGNSPVRPIMGPSSVIVLTGREHMRQRKLLLPPFHGERMREYEDVIVGATRREMATWDMGRPMRLQDSTRRITLEVILRAVFGVEGERMEPLRQAIGDLLAPMHTIRMIRFAMSRKLLARPMGDVGRALDTLDVRIHEEIDRRREQGDLGQRADILSLLMQARDEEGVEMSSEELRDELVTLLLAGHETTSTSVAWAVERLVRHPEKLRRLVAEIDGEGGDEYMTAVVNETLRVRPVVPMVSRVLTEPMRVGASHLPAGTRVMPSIYLTNRNPRVYDRPGEFMPERFLQSAPETFSWIPFGGGIRRCIGASFATLEMKLMLQTMLSELSPWVPSGWRRQRGELIRRRAITLVPAAGALLVWERRPERG
jgi:cytochrome P450 family 135